MPLARRLFTIGSLGLGITVAAIAQAGTQLFEGSWSVKAFGNECSLAASGSAPGPHCGNGAPESLTYSAVGLPQGVQCNPWFPRCPFTSTPTDGFGAFAPLGGVQRKADYCAPWANWQGNGTTARPAKGATATNASGRITPPLYRNPAFFSAAGEPNTTHCSAASTNGTGGKGLVQAGNPLTGTWYATTTSAPNGDIYFAAALATDPGVRAGVRTTNQAGEPPIYGSYSNYRYTYATLRNDWAFFGPALGPGSFNIRHKRGAHTIASINVKQGAAKFGGTMRMLGALTSKACKYRNGGCSMGTANWRYDAIGTSAPTSNGNVTAGYLTYAKAYYYHTALMFTSTVDIEGSRFPWTTGSVTITAAGRGPHKTVHYERGYDNRTTYLGSSRGTLKLVTPTLTRWLQPALNFETGGIGILSLKIIPVDGCGDCDGVGDRVDNCVDTPNPAQDDIDGDGCGNLCDADYDNDGRVGFVDFGSFAQHFGTTNPLYNHTEPVYDAVGFADFGFFASHFGAAPGPSGTTSGTIACP